MALWVCTGCTTKYAVGLTRCPRCHVTEFVEDGQPMPKNTVDTGVSHEAAEPGQPGYVGGQAPEPARKPAKASKAAAAAPAAPDVTAEPEGGEEPSPGNSSQTSDEKQTTSQQTSENAARKPARTTGSRSSR